MRFFGTVGTRSPRCGNLMRRLEEFLYLAAMFVVYSVRWVMNRKSRDLAVLLFLLALAGLGVWIGIVVSGLRGS